MLEGVTAGGIEGSERAQDKSSGGWWVMGATGRRGRGRGSMRRAWLVGGRGSGRRALLRGGEAVVDEREYVIRTGKRWMDKVRSG